MGGKRRKGPCGLTRYFLGLGWIELGWDGLGRVGLRLMSSVTPPGMFYALVFTTAPSLHLCLLHPLCFTYLLTTHCFLFFFFFFFLSLPLLLPLGTRGSFSGRELPSPHSVWLKKLQRSKKGGLRKHVGEETGKNSSLPDTV